MRRFQFHLITLILFVAFSGFLMARNLTARVNDAGQVLYGCPCIIYMVEPSDSGAKATWFPKSLVYDVGVALGALFLVCALSERFLAGERNSRAWKMAQISLCLLVVGILLYMTFQIPRIAGPEAYEGICIVGAQQYHVTSAESFGWPWPVETHRYYDDNSIGVDYSRANLLYDLVVEIGIIGIVVFLLRKVSCSHPRPDNRSTLADKPPAPDP